MTLQQLVEAMDTQILKGDILGAFNTFAAENCKTLSAPEDKTESKAQKAEILGWFLDNIASINRIERPAFRTVGTDVTESQFVFDFTNRQGESLVFNEVIRRTWNNGKMVEEQYLANQTIEAPKTAAAKKPTKKESVKDVQPAAAKAAKTVKIAEPKAEKPVKAAAPKAEKVVKATTAKTEKPAKTAAPKADKKTASKTDKRK